MKFKTGEPVPEILRNSLKQILDTRDYMAISTGNKITSEAIMKDLLNGSKITGHNIDAVHEMLRHGIAKCDTLINLYTRLKNIIGMYKPETAGTNPL